MKRKYILLLLIIVVLPGILLPGCKGSSQKTTRKLNIYIDMKDSLSENIVRYLIEDFNKKNPDIKIEFTNMFGNNKLDNPGSNDKDAIINSINNNKIDILLTSRNRMIELSQKGLISDLSTYYEKFHINNEYLSSFTNYGRYGDKYFGAGLIPYVMEVVYNKNALSKLALKTPNNMQDLKPILKYLIANNIKIPYITNGDIDINNVITSLVASNTVDLAEMEKIYGSQPGDYKSVSSMQGVFDMIHNWVKDGLVDNNLLEKGSEISINSINNGDIPLLFTTSYFNNKLENSCDILKDYSLLPNTKEVVPVIVNSLFCVPTNSKNGSEINDFFNYIYSSETQIKIAQSGQITGERKANAIFKGVNFEASKLMDLKDGNNMLLYYNVPEKISTGVSTKITDILKGKYDGNEWKEITDSYGK